jgi:cyclic pyranopterin monophosphate synthase
MARGNDRKPRKRRLSHVDERGRARMVDVGEKQVTERVAVAGATVRMRPATLRLIRSGNVTKGEVLAVARIAGILAAKRTAEIVPLCHPLPIEVAGIEFAPRSNGRLDIQATVKVSGKTGVEMEALTAVSAAALTVYDMCKAVDRAMTITDVRLLEKRGGRSGTYRRRGSRPIRR